jgi:RNA polymerase sigma-70 factor (ECF subfamily)
MADLEKRLYEQVLVVRCQTGDETAFAELVQRFGPRLRYYLQRTFGKADGAEDAWQDVWFTVFRKLRNLADPAAFSTWVYQIARNRAYDVLRRRRTFRPMTDAEEVIDPGAEEDSFSAEDGHSIHAALGELALEHQEVLVLRFLEDMSYDDIAAVTGCQVGTVKSRLHYAKRALRGILERAKIHERT